MLLMHRLELPVSPSWFIFWHLGGQQIEFCCTDFSAFLNLSSIYLHSMYTHSNRFTWLQCCQGIKKKTTVNSATCLRVWRWIFSTVLFVELINSCVLLWIFRHRTSYYLQVAHVYGWAQWPILNTECVSSTFIYMNPLNNKHFFEQISRHCHNIVGYRSSFVILCARQYAGAIASKELPMICQSPELWMSFAFQPVPWSQTSNSPGIYSWFSCLHAKHPALAYFSGSAALLRLEYKLHLKWNSSHYIVFLLLSLRKNKQTLCSICL